MPLRTRPDLRFPADSLLPGQMPTQEANTPVGRLDRQIERLKASVRAKVEHPFHIIKNRFGLRKLRLLALHTQVAS